MTTSIELLAGVFLASVLIAIARLRKQEDRFFGIVLVLAAVYYVVRAAAGGTQQELLLELPGLILFGAMGVSGYFGRRRVLAAGWILHSAWDILLHTGGRGAFVPEWYPMLCVGFDLFLAGYIVSLALLQTKQGELTREVRDIHSIVSD